MNTVQNAFSHRKGYKVFRVRCRSTCGVQPFANGASVRLWCFERVGTVIAKLLQIFLSSIQLQLPQINSCWRGVWLLEFRSCIEARRDLMWWQIVNRGYNYAMWQRHPIEGGLSYGHLVNCFNLKVVFADSQLWCQKMTKTSNRRWVHMRGPWLTDLKVPVIPRSWL